MIKVRLEVLPSLAESLGMEATGEEIISDQETGGERSVRGLLNRLGARHERFGRIVFDISAQKLTDKVAIFLNGRTLELVNGLDTKLSNGDTLTFVPLIEGG